ncbi:MAG TPA: DNA-binding protein [archaeon]|nr:DNA-binding protein [archaeon]
MNDDELRQKKLEELQNQYSKMQEEEKKHQEAEQKMQQMLNRLLEEDAKARLANVALVNKELYMKAFQAIVELAQKGYVRGKLNDEQVKQILIQLKNTREPKINIKRK